MLLFLLEIVICYKKQIKNAECPAKPSGFNDVSQNTNIVAKSYLWASNNQNIKRIDTLNSIIWICNCKFSNQQTTTKGGALYIYLTSKNSPKTIKNNTILNCTFENCKSTTSTKGNGGGAIYLDYAVDMYSNIINCLFIGNTVLNQRGGAIYIKPRKGSIDSCTFKDNDAKTGASIYYDKVNTDTFYFVNNKFEQCNAIPSSKGIVEIYWTTNSNFNFQKNTFTSTCSKEVYCLLFSTNNRGTPTDQNAIIKSNCYFANCKVIATGTKISTLATYSNTNYNYNTNKNNYTNKYNYTYKINYTNQYNFTYKIY